MANWGYDAENGPETWSSKYPQAGGSNQSPVEILSEAVVPKEYDPPLEWRYDEGICKSIINSGCGWRVDVDGKSNLSGGPLTDSYKLTQFHCHWGNSSSCGSEHVVDGKAYAGELHFVHWNKDKFSNIEQAVPAPSGLTVIGVLLEEGEKNSEIEKLCETISKIPAKDDRVELTENINPVLMFPANQAYWTYPGSLTTPPCHESVNWILFKNPISVSEEQLNVFRQMKKACICEDSESSEFVEYNYRPPQSLNDREICECV